MAKSARTLDTMLPRWTKRAATDMTGRDPLGLSRVSGFLADHLLRGIVTGTSLARYYSLYCWVLWHVAKHDQPTDESQFRTGFQRRDAAIGLCNVAANVDRYFPGVDATKKAYERGRQLGEFLCDFQVLPSQRYGPYSQNYRGCLYHLGLTKTDEGGIDHVTEGRAAALAEAVDRCLKQTPYGEKSLFKRKSMDPAELKKTWERMSVFGITQPFAEEERRLLTAVFFSLDQKQMGQGDEFRRLSLLRMLHLISAYGERGLPVTWDDLDDALVYFPAYYGVLLCTGSKEVPYEPPKRLAVCNDWWRQFALHQYLTLALETLLCSVLEIVGADFRGLPLSELIEKLVGVKFQATLRRIAGSARAPIDLLAALGVAGPPPDAAKCAAARRALGTKHEMCEETLLGVEDSDPCATAAIAVAVLGVLYSKWRGATDDAAYVSVSSQTNDIWSGNILPLLDSWLERSTTWTEAVAQLLKVLHLQHDHVLFDKHRLDSAWLEVIEERMRKVQDYSAYARSPRHGSSVAILKDLGLLSESDGGIRIAKRGEALLRSELA